jgi:hypothetical protein
VEVEVRDINGSLVTRSSLGLEVVLEQMLAGTSINNSAAVKPPADNSSSVFVLTVPEMWISGATKYKSAVRGSSRFRRVPEGRLPAPALPSASLCVGPHCA